MENKRACINNHGYSAFEHDVADLPCSFIRMKQKGRPVLVARIHMQATAPSDDFVSALRPHVNELNMRLPLLTVSVDSLQGNRFCFVLQGVNSHEITSASMSHFLTLLSQDVKTLVAYLSLHNVTANFGVATEVG